MNHIKRIRGHVLTSAMGLILLAFSACIASPPSAHASMDAQAIELTVLQNMRANGYDGLSAVNGGNGGLWINWRTGSNPLTTNWNGAPTNECIVTNGVPSCISYPPREDPLTDLRYLHNLELYKNQNPTDSQFDQQIQTWTSIVKYEWVNPRDQRGWVYDELFDLYRLTGDSWYAAKADALVTHYVTRNYHPNCSCFYLTSRSHPHGYYRPVDMLTEATALIQEGTRVGNQAWVTDGTLAFTFIYTHAYLSAWKVFPLEMDDVLNSDRTINQNELFLVEKGKKVGDQVKMGEVAQEAEMMLHAWRTTQNAFYQTTAQSLLDGMTAAVNKLGMWDTIYGGYCQQADFSGTSYQNPGVPIIACSKKEIGRQLIMLDAYHLADATGLAMRYADMESELTNLATNQGYDATAEGYLYEMQQNFSIITIKGQPADWVTSEADGAALEALFSLSDPVPW